MFVLVGFLALLSLNVILDELALRIGNMCQYPYTLVSVFISIVHGVCLWIGLNYVSKLDIESYGCKCNGLVIYVIQGSYLLPCEREYHQPSCHIIILCMQVFVT